MRAAKNERMRKKKSRPLKNSRIRKYARIHHTFPLNIFPETTMAVDEIPLSIDSKLFIYLYETIVDGLASNAEHTKRTTLLSMPKLIYRCKTINS